MYSSPEQTRKNSKLDGRSGKLMQSYHVNNSNAKNKVIPILTPLWLHFFLLCLWSDIWSCGVILYQMFSLLVDVPFDPVEIIVNKTTVPPLSLYTKTPLSSNMHGIIMKALEVDPSKRFQTAEEMGDALHQEEARLLDGIKNPTIQFGKSETKSEASLASTSPTQSASSTSHTALQPSNISPPSSQPPSSASPSHSKPSLPPSLPIHSRYQAGRSRRPFASGLTTEFPTSKL